MGALIWKREAVHALVVVSAWFGVLLVVFALASFLPGTIALDPSEDAKSADDPEAVCSAGGMSQPGICSEWIFRHRNDTFANHSWASDVSVSPDGQHVYITGGSDEPRSLMGYTLPSHHPSGRYLSGHSDILTIALDAETGEEVWTARSGPGAEDIASSITTNPAGTLVFVTGASWQGESFDAFTRAYDAGTGTVAWEATYQGSANHPDVGHHVVSSPDGKVVYVAGWTSAKEEDLNQLVLAYDAETGDPLWETQHDGPAKGDDYAWGLQVSPDGGSVYASGVSQRAEESQGQAAYNKTVASYDAGTGATEWTTHLQSNQLHGHVFASAPEGWPAPALSPDGNRLFVTGSHPEGGITTWAVSTEDGSSLWRATLPSSGDFGMPSAGLATSPDGSLLHVGATLGNTTGSPDLNYTIVTYETGTGSEAWRAQYDNPRVNCHSSCYELARDLAASPDGGHVFVTGQSKGDGFDGWNQATLSFDAQTGQRAWEARYSPLPVRVVENPDFTPGGFAIDVSPSSQTVYVAGSSAITETRHCPIHIGGPSGILHDFLCAGYTNYDATVTAYDDELGQVQG